MLGFASLTMLAALANYATLRSANYAPFGR